MTDAVLTESEQEAKKRLTESVNDLQKAFVKRLQAQPGLDLAGMSLNLQLINIQIETLCALLVEDHPALRERLWHALTAAFDKAAAEHLKAMIIAPEPFRKQ